MLQESLIANSLANSSPSLTPQQRQRALAIAAELRRRGLAGTAAIPFEDWLAAVSPQHRWDWAHLRYIRAKLDGVTRGDIDRLMLFLPPRHGKSELVTVRYATHFLECQPDKNVIIGAYNQTLANKFSRKARAIAESRLKFNDSRTAVEEWETAQGGIFRAVGVGSGVTGQGGNLIIIDDPVKNREEAESQVYRDKVWDWYTDDLYTRAEPDAPIILIMTRWHKDDLAGRILASEDGKNWEVVCLPAEAEPGDPLGRTLGEALCPDRYDIKKLMRIKSVLGRSYSALYQQRPVPREGGMFKEIWLKLVDAVPAQARRVRWWDKASTEGGGDFTAGTLMAYADGIWYVEDIVSGQWSSGERDQTIKDTARKDKERGHVIQWGEQEPGSSGKDAAQEFVRMLAGHEVHTEPTTGSKELACEPFASQAEAGNVRVKRAAWTSGFVSQACDFPTGKNDDMIEAAARAFLKLADTEEAAGETVNADPYQFSTSPY